MSQEARLEEGGRLAAAKKLSSETSLSSTFGFLTPQLARSLDALRSEEKPLTSDPVNRNSLSLSVHCRAWGYSFLFKRRGFGTGSPEDASVVLNTSSAIS